MLARKAPRDFIHVDEFWEADEYWNHYFISSSVWVYADEYRAELPGDEDQDQHNIGDRRSAGRVNDRGGYGPDNTVPAALDPAREIRHAV